MSDNSPTRMLKPTCTSWSWSLLPFEDVVRIMSMLGFRAIDVGAFAGWAHYEPDDLSECPQKMAREVKEIGDRHEMALTDLIVTFGTGLVENCVNCPDPSIREANRETFKGLTEFCRYAGIPGITLCPGVVHESLGRVGSIELAVEELTRLAEIGQDAELRVSFEPHVESITETPEEALKLVWQVPHLSFTLDYSHFLYLGFTESQVDPLLPYAGHIHLRQARQHVLQCRTADGEINFERVLSRLCQLDYKGWVAFEYVWEQWLDNDRVDVLSETLVLKKQLARFFDRRLCVAPKKG